jgi:excinuclease ABC subunit C
VSSLFPDKHFAGFGPSRFQPCSSAATLHGVTASNAVALRAEVRKQCPRRPGVYGMIDPRGRLIYVGKAKCLRARLLGYFRADSRDAKSGRIIEATRAVIWEFAANEFAALLRELELIRRWTPPYNVQGRPGRRRGMYIVLGKKPAPYLFATAEPPTDPVACYGPLPGSAFVQEAARRLNDLFRLRDCPQSQTMRFAEQGELFPEGRPAGCLRYELGTCSGPCAGFVTRGRYRRQVRDARAFLDGTDDGLFARLEREMASAAAAQQYERAAAVRDKLTFVRAVRARLEWLQEARREFSLVYQLPDEEGRPLWYLIRQGQVRAVIRRPHDSKSRRETRTAIERIFRTGRSENGPLAIDRLDGILLVAAWFRKRPEERANVLTPEHALELCRPTAALMA